MEEPAKVVTRGFVDLLIGVFLLVGGLVALCIPVYVGTYDRWGIQLKCGNGYYSQLLQATIDDQGHDPQDPQFAPADASPADRPGTDHVDQCKSALAHRRAWLVPVACVGALILVPELVAWARAGSSNSPASINAWSGTPADASARDTSTRSAALLDRRDCSHRARSTNTTV